MFTHTPFRPSRISPSIPLLSLFYLISLSLSDPQPVEAAHLVRYVDVDITDTRSASTTPDCTNYSPSTGECGGGFESGYSSLKDVNAFLDNMSTSDSATIYFQRGDRWTFTSDSDCINITNSNVTLDAYGSGNKPIIDGNNTYPSQLSTAGNPVGYAINVGGRSTCTTNVHIKNLKIYRMYPGGGIIFKGPTGYGNGFFQGRGSIENCDIHTIGWAAINVYCVPPTLGIVEIENNYIHDVVRYGDPSGANHLGPQAINVALTHGHVCRYNKIIGSFGEGIGAGGFGLVEYNVVSQTGNPAIYIDGVGEDTDSTVVVRYNLVWGSSDRSYENRKSFQPAAIRSDCESVDSVNNYRASLEIYGNICIGYDAGLDFRVNPEGTGSSYVSRNDLGSLKAYNNTVVDCKSSLITVNTQRFRSAALKNNVFIIHSDAASVCQHTKTWGVDNSWSNWTWGPNFWYGDTVPESPFYTAAKDATGNPGLSKSSGWRGLTSLNDFSFSDYVPSPTSPLVNNPKAERLSPTEGYARNFLTIGTEYKHLPDIIQIVLSDQNSDGEYWGFGAVVRSEQNEPLSPPRNLMLISPAD